VEPYFFDFVDEPSDAVDGRTKRVAEVENVVPLAFSIDDVLGNDDFHETMDEGVENDDNHSIHSSIHISLESDVNFLEEVDVDSEIFLDFDFQFCEAPDFDEDLVDDVDDWDVHSDIDRNFNAIDRQNFF
jgi:hypothetical protein